MSKKQRIINMSNTPRTDAVVFDADLVSASFARELERELATECAINQRNCEDWAHDHTHLQNLCRKAGYDENAVEGDRYGIRSIEQLGDMLMEKIELLDRELAQVKEENARLREAIKSLYCIAEEGADYGLSDTAHDLCGWNSDYEDLVLPNAQSPR